MLLRLLSLSFLLAACQGAPPQPAQEPAKAPPPLVIDEAFEPLESLSAYGLFVGDGASQEPAPGVVPYDVNTALFADYTAKYRFVKLPAGQSAIYDADKPFAFPVGTILVKTFASLKDLRDPNLGRRLIETRLLIHKPSGWIAVAYQWNEAQTNATLQEVGAEVTLRWIHTDGKERSERYLIPNTNQCKGCHEDKDRVMQPLGPRARNVNRSFAYKEGEKNQLSYWSTVGILQGAPKPEEAPKLAVWDDPKTGDVNARARAWLEVNCAHCHNPKGPARGSGLNLLSTNQDPGSLGIMKTPVAAGRGSGGRRYDIVPGKPDESILMYRVESTEPDVMMPELPRRLVDEEGVALLKEWINTLP